MTAGVSRCGAFGCVMQTGDPLCVFHARRVRRGLGLPTAAYLRVGDRSGHGVWGRVDRTAEGVLCHECGQRFASLGIHLARAHELTVRIIGIGTGSLMRSRWRSCRRGGRGGVRIRVGGAARS